MYQLAEIITGMLALVILIRLCALLGRHSSREDVKMLLGESLLLKGGRGARDRDS
jgi:hypothetical protein